MRIYMPFVISVAAIPALGLSAWRVIAPETHGEFMAIPVLGWLVRIYSTVAFFALFLLVFFVLLLGVFAVIARIFRQPPKAERNIHGDWFLPEANTLALRDRGILRIAVHHGDQGCGLMAIPQTDEAVPFALQSLPNADTEIREWFARRLNIDAATITIEVDPHATEPCRIIRWSTAEVHKP